MIATDPWLKFKLRHHRVRQAYPPNLQLAPPAAYRFISLSRAELILQKRADIAGLDPFGNKAIADGAGEHESERAFRAASASPSRPGMTVPKSFSEARNGLSLLVQTTSGVKVNKRAARPAVLKSPRRNASRTSSSL